MRKYELTGETKLIRPSDGDMVRKNEYEKTMKGAANAVY